MAIIDEFYVGVAFLRSRDREIQRLRRQQRGLQTTGDDVAALVMDVEDSDDG